MLPYYQLSLRRCVHQRPLYLKFYSSQSSPKESPVKSTSKLEEDDDEDVVVPLPLLQRPLGVMEPPTTVKKTSKDTLNDMMDQKKRTDNRNHIIKEAGKGYFSDLNATRRHGGKTWIAPTVMIREDKSLYFPNVLGSALDGSGKKHTTDMCKGRISIISMLSSKISEIHVAGFTGATHARFSSHPLYTPVSINLQENLLKSFLVSLFLSSIRKQVAPDLHATYLVSGQNMEYVREPLGLVNKHVGYVYLLDENLKVRWAGCADAKPEEARALESCASVLLDRLQKKVEGKDAVPPQP